MSLASLQTALAAVDAALAAYLQTKESYSIDGRSWQHDAHYESLLKRRQELRRLIIEETGAVEIHTQLLG